MPGFSTDSNDPTKTVVYADNVQFDGSDSPGSVTTNGQLLIGSTTDPNIKVGNIVSPLGTLQIGYAAPNITADLVGGFTDLHTAKLIVNSTPNAGGNYTTIADALSVSVSGDTIFVMPGTTGIYTENLTLKAGVNICSFDCDAITPNVTIIGKCTATFVGTCSISGIRLQTNSDFCLAITGNSATNVILVNCYINALNNTAISYTSSSATSGVFLWKCLGNIGTTGIALFACSGSGFTTIIDCKLTNTGNSLTANTHSAGFLEVDGTAMNNPITTSGTSTLFLDASSLSMVTGSALNITALTCGGNGVNRSFDTYFSSGTASAISIGSTLLLSGGTIESSNASAITGAGSVSFSTTDFFGTSSTIGTTTQIPLVTSNDAIKVVTPGAYPYTTTPQDAIILVDTSVARTIVPLASPTTGQKHIIKDSVGSAAANNITVTPSGKNIDGAASSTINIAYGSITIVYGGAEWKIT